MRAHHCGVRLLLGALLNLVVAAQSGDATVVAVPTEGFEECRCATRDEFMARHDVNASQAALAKLGANLELGVFGISCGAHDASFSYCQAATPPMCYLQSSTSCRLRHAVSAVFTEATAVEFYSHATCGSVDPSARVAIDSSLQGRVMRVGFRSEIGGWMGALHPDGNPPHGMYLDGRWSGPAVDLVQTVAERAGFVIKMTDAPEWVYLQAAQNGAQDTYAECVYAVSLGYLDFCAGLYLLDATSSALTQMITVTTDPLYVVSKMAAPTLSARAMLVFSPFDVTVWLMMICLPIATSLLVLLQEVTQQAMDGLDEDEDEEDPTQRWAHAVAQRTFVGLLSVMNGGVEFNGEVVSWGGRVTTIGLGLFILFMVNVFGANLTNILVSDNDTPEVTGLKDAIDRGVPLCILRELLEDVRDHYPDIVFATDEDGKPGLEPLPSGFDPVFEAMEENKCVAALVMVEELQLAWSQKLGCDVQIVGNRIMDVRRGIPVIDTSNANPLQASPINAFSLRWHFQEFLNTGAFQIMLRERMPASSCPADGGGGSGGDQLHFVDLIGPFLSLSVFLVLGAVLTGMEIVAATIWVKLEEQVVNPPRTSAPLLAAQQSQDLDEYFAIVSGMPGTGVPGL